MSLAPRYSVLRLLLLLLFCFGLIASLLRPATVAAQEKPSAWKDVKVPEIWRTSSPGSLGNNLGFGWYRCLVDIPAEWRGKTLQLYLESIDDAREVYINGVKVAALGVFPPK